ncbi:MAG: 50S ribosomal protein L24 [Candidatus Pacebacteria bacterium]|nr:50S ribosomal protein L24 [Candidatus Paceibacterota bacterium]PIR64043.1 MAG: 50S ribosomal protein L24 [Candidatus Pacebacteria bacterium CG10_big_fil_rev_8_21_14_0_10_40_26]PIZ78147.1 MAG: 50S ribosomal protein L24 [Candidatus Pacebacteria bacterium CG_4_10_14_0_2_um_filter_40_20]PJA69119.1 MAG: 50S ribosomal protein L24 [Candidatus Pacebacteria bacterium CG_4_9_14_3_um_filter_40_12]PJC41748.1 MAG: 50S ribosomal protein L24 [Candidatus Pacebacteria bacterium CG_4_9_14_0_2_um_filter_40_15]
MKFKVGDKVKVTSGKDKGKLSSIVKVIPKKNTVVVEGANMYVKHVKPMGGRSGDKLSVERALSTAKIALVNDKGEVDRIGYKVAKDGSKTRVFKKTGAAVPEPKTEAKK